MPEAGLSPPREFGKKGPAPRFCGLQSPSTSCLGYRSISLLSFAVHFFPSKTAIKRPEQRVCHQFVCHAFPPFIIIVRIELKSVRSLSCPFPFLTNLLVRFFEQMPFGYMPCLGIRGLSAQYVDQRNPSNWVDVQTSMNPRVYVYNSSFSCIL